MAGKDHRYRDKRAKFVRWKTEFLTPSDHIVSLGSRIAKSLRGHVKRNQPALVEGPR